MEPTRNSWQRRHDSLRDLIALLASSRFSSQRELARTLWPDKSSPEVTLTEFKTERKNGRVLNCFQLNSLYSDITFRLKRAGLPLPQPTTNGEAAVALQSPPPAPATAPAPAPSAPRRSSALMVLPLKDIEGGKLGGHCLVMCLGSAVPDDDRWTLTARGHELQLRLGYCARYTFGARGAAGLGGRTFEIDIGKLDSVTELHLHGGPLWVAREIMGTVNDLSQRRIVGRASAKSGVHVGDSSPAQLWRAIMTYCEMPKSKPHALDLCGLTHPKVVELMALAKAAPPSPAPSHNIGCRTPPPLAPSHNVGSRTGGLSKLTEDGSQLRRIGTIAGPAFVAAMESVSPGEPERVFQQLMKRPSFRNRFFTDFQRQIFSPKAVRDRLLEEPFFDGMVCVYHALKGWKAKRRHLSLFAPYFPWSVTCTLFGVSQWIVYAARLHAGEHGAERPVPPVLVSFRLKPEQVEFLADFVNRPELTQMLATNQRAGDWKCELHLRPEQLARKYQEIVPSHLRIGRTEVLDYLRQDCFRLSRAKSCLCGLCMACARSTGGRTSRTSSL